MLEQNPKESGGPRAGTGQRVRGQPRRGGGERGAPNTGVEMLMAQFLGEVGGDPRG